MVVEADLCEPGGMARRVPALVAVPGARGQCCPLHGCRSASQAAALGSAQQSLAVAFRQKCMKVRTFSTCRTENEVFAQFSHPTSGISQQRL